MLFRSRRIRNIFIVIVLVHGSGRLQVLASVCDRFEVRGYNVGEADVRERGGDLSDLGLESTSILREGG